ncbi:class I SAM-dependent methyltransferase [Jannaschia sp. R86511]|uniref:class I SAM-dependent methyltransferase n=1 Tax=Jannaschia sp. R86511 TaxID=3093853 RepID=UPI0036D26676
MSRDQGLLRDVYLGVMTGARRGLDRTRLLNMWDRQVAANPRSVSAHLRTLLAVHNAEDLVRMDLPWWTYQAVDAVDAFLARHDGAGRVFEYGSGASTLWLARRAGSVDAVEHEAEWAERVRELLATTPGLRCTPTVHVPAVPTSTSPVVASGAPSGQGLDFADYVKAIDDVPGDFDLVLVDGRARGEVLLHVLDRVAPGGLVLLDDAQRTRYSPAVDEAARRGWLVRRTRGATPCQPVPRETVLLSREPAALGG